MHVSATRFTAHDLFVAGHETDIAPRKTLVVHVDVAHRGVGTASCGPDILERYRVLTGKHTFSYRLSAQQLRMGSGPFRNSAGVMPLVEVR